MMIPALALTVMSILGGSLQNISFADSSIETHEIQINESESMEKEERLSYTKTATLKQGQQVNYRINMGLAGTHRRINLKFTDLEPGSTVKFEIRALNHSGVVINKVIASGTATNSTGSAGKTVEVPTGVPHQVRIIMQKTNQTNGDKFTTTINTLK